MFQIHPEGPLDGPAIERLLDRCFGIGRQRKTSYRYRVGSEPERGLSLVARDGGRLVGAIRYWRLLLDDRPALLLGPLAIEPALRGLGIGRALVRRSLALAAPTWRLVFLVGDPAYYRQFGFRLPPREVVMPGEDPARLQWLGLSGADLPEAGGVLRRWRDGGLLGQPREAGEQRLAQRRDALVASHRGGHLAQPGGHRRRHPRHARDLAERPDEAADAERHRAALGQPAQGLPLDPEPQPLADIA
jgi:predicted N-acetyltransferase YhbS